MCRSVDSHGGGVDTTSCAAAVTAYSDSVTCCPLSHRLTTSCAAPLPSSAEALTGRASVCRDDDVAQGSPAGQGYCRYYCICSLWSLPSPDTDVNISLDDTTSQVKVKE